MRIGRLEDVIRLGAAVGSSRTNVACSDIASDLTFSLCRGLNWVLLVPLPIAAEC